MVRINLLPARVSRKKEAGKQQLVLFVLLLVAGLALNWLYHDSRMAVLKAAQKRLDDTRTEIADLDKTIGVVNTLAADKADLAQKLAVLDRLKAGRSGPVRMLDELAGLTPRRLWLRKMDEKGGKVTFEGTGASIDDVSELMKKMKESKYFADVELKKTETKSTGPLRTVEFTLTATAKYAPGPEATAAGADAGAGKPKAGG